MSFIVRHWYLSVGLAGIMLVFEALLSLSSGSSALPYYLSTLGWPAALLAQPLTSPVVAASLSLMAAMGCLMVLYTATSYIESPLFTKRILVAVFLAGASYLFFLSLARIELSSAAALLRAFLLLSSLPSNPYLAALALALELFPPSGYGVPLGLKAEWQFSLVSGNLLLVSSLFLLLLGLIFALSVFMEGWSVDRKVFYVTGGIASLLAAVSEFTFPLSSAMRGLSAGYLVLPPSLFGGNPHVEGATLLLLSLALLSLAFSRTLPVDAERFFMLVVAAVYACSLLCILVFIGSVTLPLVFLLALKLAAGSLTLLVVFVEIKNFLVKREAG